MSNPVDRIKTLMESLPDKDIPLGYKFLEERNFTSLKELVDSAIYKVKKSQKSENPKEEYAKISVEDLSRLKSEVDVYIALLVLPSDDIFTETYYLDDEDFCL